MTEHAGEGSEEALIEYNNIDEALGTAVVSSKVLEIYGRLNKNTGPALLAECQDKCGARLAIIKGAEVISARFFEMAMSTRNAGKIEKVLKDLHESSIAIAAAINKR